MTWEQIAPWVTLVGLALTAGAVIYPFLRAKDRDARDTAANALAQTQSHRISILEGERDDFERKLGDCLKRRSELEAEAKIHMDIIEKAIRHERD